MLDSRTHIIITAPGNPDCMCTLCTRHPLATRLMRVHTPHNAETMNIADVYLCDSCATWLYLQLVPSELLSSAPPKTATTSFESKYGDKV